MGKLYIVVRNDIAPGLQMAQSVHAGRAIGGPVPPRGENLACLQVPSEGDLIELVKIAVCRDIRHVVFREPDMGGEVTAVAFGCEARRILSNLPLALKPEKPAA